MMLAQIIAQAKVLKGKTQNLVLKLKRRMNWFDIGSNIDTSDCVNKELLYDSINSPNKKYMGRYVPTDLRELKNILDFLVNFDKSILTHTFIDFGCGKGRVLIAAARIGFKKVIGVEFSQQLFSICQSNLTKVKSPATVVCEDAVDFKLTPDMRTFYFCNPFDFIIVEKVLNNIRALLKSSGKTGYVVYVDPRQFGKLNPSEYELIFTYAGPLTPYHIYKVLV